MAPLPGPLVQVPLDQIAANPRNPRQRLAGLEELAESIGAYGLLQPVILRPVEPDRYELVAGHRRFAAVRELGWTSVPSIIRDADVDEAYLLTLIENLQRTDLTPQEEATALEVLLRERSWSTRQVAQAIKRSPGYVSKRLRVFEDPLLAPLVLNHQLTVSAAEELLPLRLNRKRELAERSVAEHWEHGQVRAAVMGDAQQKTHQLAGLRREVRALRKTLTRVSPWELTEAHRRELRLLFMDLVYVARAPAEKRPIVFPELPNVAPRSRRASRERASNQQA